MLAWQGSSDHFKEHQVPSVGNWPKIQQFVSDFSWAQTKLRGEELRSNLIPRTRCDPKEPSQAAITAPLPCRGAIEEFWLENIFKIMKSSHKLNTSASSQQSGGIFWMYPRSLQRKGFLWAGNGHNPGELQRATPANDLQHWICFNSTFYVQFCDPWRWKMPQNCKSVPLLRSELMLFQYFWKWHTNNSMMI